MRNLLIALSILLGSATPAHAQISVGIAVPGISIGINLPVYPELARVPGYPVYYAPRADLNLFFYDGLYWVFQGDNWYASSWYNGPWQLVGPEYVPLFVLRIPVRYYRQPPVYFRGWRSDAPPRWGEHWGREWEQRRGGWDQWDRRSAPPPAPAPVYQRKYSGNRYPSAVEQQHTIRSENYRYQPREAVTQQHYQQQGSSRAEPHQQAPGQKRPSTQEQRSQPTQPHPQAQPTQPPPQMQRPQAEPQGQGKGHENKGESQGKGQENKKE